MTRAFLSLLSGETKKLEQAGLYKPEVVFPPPGQPGAHRTAAGRIDFVGDDYLGLGRDPSVLDAARNALERDGAGTGSARVFRGTRAVHKDLEKALASFLQLQDAIVFGAGYLANVGLFEALFDNRDCLFCDALVHPSLAAGVRLSSAAAFPYRNNDVDDLEDKLKRSRAARFRAVVTDGVFALDGHVAALDRICALADRYDALVVLDDSLGVGVLGARGRGTRELRFAMDRVDVVTGTFGTALGGAPGGYVAGRREVIEWLRQKATPYLFSAALGPPSAAAAQKALEILARGQAPLSLLRQRMEQLRGGLESKGFRVLGGEHPICAVVVGGVVTLQKMVNALFLEGIHVNGLCYPVVPEEEARIRVTVTAAHSEDEIARALAAFEKVGRAQGVLGKASGAAAARRKA